MMQKLMLLLLFVAVCACTGKSNSKDKTEQTTQKTEQQSNDEKEQHTAALLYTRLKAKADTAKQYCRKNGLNANYCMLVDMSIHSGKNRFFVWNFITDSIANSGLCCHGYGLNSTTDNPVFSNVPGSYCSSLGKYKTGVRAYSNWGIHAHYKLHGLDATNSNAYKRMVVLHSYSYVPEYEIHPDHLPLGYSQGCPVIDNALMTILDGILKKTTKPILLWIYNE